MKLSNKLGHQAPKDWRRNDFNSIEIKGDLSFCESHNFMYDSKEEERKLYWAKPCYYTDSRFEDGGHNYYKNSMIHWTRFKSISLKSCIRRALRVRNIPVGTIVNFKKSYYHPGKNIDNSFAFKIKKENKLDIEYNIDGESYSNNFKTCDWSKNLTDKLRESGFLVQVYNSNPGYLIGEEEGEIAIAYGHGKKIGFSSARESFRGYQNGCENVLYDFYDEFDKWSQCLEISKDTPVDDIVTMIINDEPEDLDSKYYLYNK